MTKKLGKLSKGKMKDILFYCLMLAWPVAQFLVFYIGVNGNSILMAFQNIDTDAKTITWTLDNFKNAFTLMTTSQLLLGALKMSILSYLLILGIGTPLGLLFSYYIYKNHFGSNFFKVLLFLPSIISSIVMVTIYRYFVEKALPEVANSWLGWLGITMEGLLENPSTRFATIIFYNIWVGFGTSTLMYSNAMAGISPEIVESAHVDGATGFREFWHITLPMVYPTLTTFLITGVAGLFTNQINLFSFYGDGAPSDLQTYGYYLYQQTSLITNDAEYPILSAMGLILTVVTVAITLIARFLLEKFGPSED